MLPHESFRVVLEKVKVNLNERIEKNKYLKIKKTYRKTRNEMVQTMAPKHGYAINSYYLGGLIMKGSKVEFINTTEGRALPKASLWTNPDSSIVNPRSRTNPFVWYWKKIK